MELTNCFHWMVNRMPAKQAMALEELKRQGHPGAQDLNVTPYFHDAFHVRSAWFDYGKFKLRPTEGMSSRDHQYLRNSLYAGMISTSEQPTLDLSYECMVTQMTLHHASVLPIPAADRENINAHASCPPRMLKRLREAFMPCTSSIAACLGRQCMAFASCVKLQQLHSQRKGSVVHNPAMQVNQCKDMPILYTSKNALQVTR